MALLEIDALRTTFHAPDSPLTVIDDLSFRVEAGQIVAIVGESGSGKSVTAMSIMRLLSNRRFSYGGAVRFEGQDLLSLSESEMCDIRGDRIGMIFQEPMTALNPVETIGYQIAEGMRLHRGLGRREAHARVLEMLEQVGIPAPARRAAEYPHQLSGGMRQRVMIAMALACDPALLIADEPTTALDVTVQAQILDLIRDQASKLELGVILITHDLGVVAELADHMVVIYAGRKVEEGRVADILENPRHPYTQGLLAATPRLEGLAQRGDRKMTEIPGNIPSLAHGMSGCAFAPRCAQVESKCWDVRPREVSTREGRVVACHRAERVPA